MTRSQRIALAMSGYRRPTLQAADFDGSLQCAMRVYSAGVYFFTKGGCYEALDDLDPYQDVNPSESIVFVRGNAGMLCS